jgi:hypothetical protein
MSPSFRSHFTSVALALGMTLVSCRDASAPDPTLVGGRCPVTAAALSGFFGCVDVTGVILDSLGAPAHFPEVEFVASSHATFPQLDSMVVAPTGRFRARFVVGPLPGFEESGSVSLDGWLRYRIPDLLSSYRPSGVVDSVEARLEFVRASAMPRRYEMTLRMRD